jgi:hypothetical protein
MDIDVSDFTPHQLRALLDLFVLALDADGQLPAANDARLDSVFAALGYTTDVERQREFEAAAARMKPHARPVQRARDQLIELSQAFTTRPQHKKVYAALQKVYSGDAHVSTVEIYLLSELRLRFRV